MSEDLTPNGVDVTKYGSLQHDFAFIHKNESFVKTFQGIEDFCQHVGEQYDLYPVLSLKQQVQLDILSLYTVNSMFWMHEKSKGSPPEAMTDIRHNLTQVQNIMKRFKMIQDKNLRPCLHKAAVGRFVRAALYDIDNKKEHEHGAPLMKKKRREM
ncbi:uncharacterized protein LOC128729087 [Anopheles nili]|uniref:uncharacterized protein LOC128729087 n=1 Tax=Anopheles nili TaxID=185578 RepID=UPI00237C39E1|nr:uncharacterized protein LOC128729087 [Anopheles nili]XP_053678714.1 uncharacterized protein LOC128729087 [Anopheles nili]